MRLQILVTRPFDCGSKSWLAMMFLGYAYLQAVRLHFVYATAKRRTAADATTRTTTDGAPRPDWTPRQQTAVAGAYSLGKLCSAFPGGVFAHRGHERSVMLCCVAVTAVAASLAPVACGRHGGWAAAALLRFVQGCASGPTGSCGGTMAKKIVPKPARNTYSTYMFSGTLFGSFLGNAFSGTIMAALSPDGSYVAMTALGLAWAAVWTTMVHVFPYDRDDRDGGDNLRDRGQVSAHSMRFASTPWSVILGSMPFVGLLIASCGYGYLFSFLAVVMPLYRESVLGGDFVENGPRVSAPWLTCWIVSVLAGVLAVSLPDAGVIKRIAIVKLYAGLVLVASPLMLVGVVIAARDRPTVSLFMYLSVVLFGFERSSIRINSLDLCSRYAGSLIAVCDVFNSVGNIVNIVISRILFTGIDDWTASFTVSITFPIMCSVLFILFASSKNQCWDQRYERPLT